MDRNFAATEINERCKGSPWPLLADAFESIREFLSTRPPYEVLRLLYEEGYAEPDVLQSVRDYVQQTYSSKHQLLRHIYGADARLRDYSEWQNLRRASPDKRALVELICGQVKLRFSWVTPRIVHSFAYRSTFFEQHPFKNWPKAKGLYEHREIPKGRKSKRSLLIPIPPLRRIQQALLRLPLTIAQTTLLPEVLGGRSKSTGENLRVGILANAATHVGQKFVVKFDLANFFPSIHVSDVISALQSLECAMILRSSAEPLRWTHDSAVLVARLVTFRGRLPQGAPTSPAIANLVFARYDQKITSRLGKDFVYTRYFDDLTFSVSASVAKRRGLLTAKHLKAHVECELEGILKGSRFRLNSRKTRATSIEDGHKITGLLISNNQVTLPRSTRRELSALMHQIKRDGLTAAAIKHVDGAIHSRTTFDIRRKEHIERDKRLSLERQSAIMIRSICPELRLEVPGETWEWGGRRIVKDPELHAGETAIRDVQRLLARIWREELSVSEEDGHFIVRAQGDKVVARIRCEKNGDFFLLSRRQAVATVKLWHRLRGWWAGLSPGYRDECFTSLEQFRLRIKETLDNVIVLGQKQKVIVSSAKRTAIVPPSVDSELPGFSLLNDSGVIRELSVDVWKLYLWFVKQSDQSEVLEKANSCVPTLMAPAVDVTLHKWLECVANLMTSLLSKLPLIVETSPSDIKTIMELIRVLFDLEDGRRTPEYSVVGQFLKEHVTKPKLRELARDDIANVQQAILVELRGLLLKCEIKYRQLGRDEWLRSLVSNSWFVSLDKRLIYAYEEFVSLQPQAVWKTTGANVFLEVSRSEIASNAPVLFQAIDEPTTLDVWKHLFRFAKCLTCCTTDCLSGGAETFSDEAKMKIHKRSPSAILGKKDLHEELSVEIGKDSARLFQVIFSMRNRDAHPDDLTQRDDWNGIQKFVAQELGKKWGSKKISMPDRLFQPDDLQLTASEGTEVKLLILQGICDALSELQPPSNFDS